VFELGLFLVFKYCSLSQYTHLKKLISLFSMSFIQCSKNDAMTQMEQKLLTRLVALTNPNCNLLSLSEVLQRGLWL